MRLSVVFLLVCGIVAVYARPCTLTCLRPKQAWTGPLPNETAATRFCDINCTQILGGTAARSGNDWLNLAQTYCAFIAQEETSGCVLSPMDICASWFEDARSQLEDPEYCNLTANPFLRYTTVLVEGCTSGRYAHGGGLPVCE